MIVNALVWSLTSTDIRRIITKGAEKFAGPLMTATKGILRMNGKNLSPDNWVRFQMKIRKWLPPCLSLLGLLVFAANSLYLMRDAGSDPIIKIHPIHTNVDMYEYFLPYLTFARKCILAGDLPLWTPYQGVGSPFFAAVQTGLLYPFNWAIFLMDVPTAMVVIQLLNTLTGMVGIITYFRHIKLEWPAVTVGASMFGFSMLALSYHNSTASTFCWIPIIFLLAHKMVEKPNFSACACLALALALSFFGGNTQSFYYIGIALAIYVFLLTLLSWSECGIKGVSFRYGLFCLAFLLMIGLTSIQSLPTIELVESSIRNSSRGFSAATAFEPYTVHLYEIGKEWFSYFGASLLLIPYAFGSARRRRIAIILLFILLYTILFIMSKHVPSLSVFGNLPLADSFRYHTRMRPITFFLIPTLSAIGLSSFWDREPVKIWNRSTRRFDVFWMLIFISLFAFLYYIWNGGSKGSFVYSAVVSVCIFVFLFLLLYATKFSKKMKNTAGWVLAMLLISESFLYTTALTVPVFTTSGKTEVFDQQLGWVREQAGYYRVFLVPHGFAGYNPNVGTMFQFFNINSYETFTMARWRNYLESFMESTKLEEKHGHETFNGVVTSEIAEAFIQNAEMTSLTSLRYLVMYESRKNEIIRDFIDDSPYAWKTIYESEDEELKVFVYENELALPRAYLVDSYEITHDEVQSLQAIKKNPLKLSSSVVLENGTPSFASAAIPTNPGQIDIVNYHINEVELSVKADRRCLAVLTDSYYPGWNAFIDGVNTPILRANSLFRAVEIPPGEHTVVFRYQPSALKWGTIISLSTALFILIGLFVENRWMGSCKFLRTNP